MERKDFVGIVAEAEGYYSESRRVCMTFIPKEAFEENRKIILDIDHYAYELDGKHSQTKYEFYAYELDCPNDEMITVMNFWYASDHCDNFYELVSEASGFPIEEMHKVEQWFGEQAYKKTVTQYIFGDEVIG